MTNDSNQTNNNIRSKIEVLSRIFIAIYIYTIMIVFAEMEINI